jgi:hypothetical protein
VASAGKAAYPGGVYKFTSARLMPSKFDRADPDSRALRACYGELADRLQREATEMRSAIHAKFYPDFGLVDGVKKRALLRRSGHWAELFRGHIERLFRHSAEVEEKLVYSLAVEMRPELDEIFHATRERKIATDRILRALSARLRVLGDGDSLDTEALYEFCALAERAALFFRYTSYRLLAPAASGVALRDGKFFGIDPAEIEQLPETLAEELDRPVQGPAPEIPLVPVTVQPSPYARRPGRALVVRQRE